MEDNFSAMLENIPHYLLTSAQPCDEVGSAIWWWDMPRTPLSLSLEARAGSRCGPVTRLGRGMEEGAAYKEGRRRDEASSS